MRVALLCLVPCVALAAPGEQRYDGAHASFSIPQGTKVTDGTDVAAEHALDVVLPDFAGCRFQVLFGDGKASDGEVDGLATAWRDKRLRNRSSWGVHASGDHRVEAAQVAGRHAVRLVDDLASSMGGRQVMLCAAVSGRLACAVASGPPEQQPKIDAALVRLLASLRLR